MWYDITINLLISKEVKEETIMKKYRIIVTDGSVVMLDKIVSATSYSKAESAAIQICKIMCGKQWHIKDTK